MSIYKYKNHIVRKRFGQNFLHDNFLAQEIIAAICPKKTDEFIEIGPGLGILTKIMMNYVDFLTVIELDYNLANKLISQNIGKDKLNIIQQDVMTVNFFSLSASSGKNLKIFGNLPYNISVPLILNLFNYINVIYDMYFVVQREVANRLIANVNNKNYGRLSIIAKYYCKITHILDISPYSFRPIPKVNSTMIRLTPHVENPYLIYDLKKLLIITNAAFKQRRKTIKNSLKEFFNVKQFADQNINPNLRAENLSLEQYCNLTKLCYNIDY